MVVVTKAEEVVVPGCPWCHFFSGVINWWIFACSSIYASKAFRVV